MNTVDRPAPAGGADHSREAAARPVELRGLTVAELETLAESLGEHRYRGRQIARWLYGHGVETVEAMTDLPQAFRGHLQAGVRITPPQLRRTMDAPDGSATKYLVGFADGQTVECVLMRFDDGRRSACLSSQVGCAMGCAFCATGLSGFSRNLTAGEILGQALLIRSQAGVRIGNVVFMGMGEPLANYDAVLRAARILASPSGLGIGMRRLTISTVGLVPQIYRLAAERLQLTLAVSLHAPTTELRDRLVPANHRYPLDELIPACRAYVAATNRRITFEYVLLDGVNDGPAEARALGRLLRGLHCHVNVIPVNPVVGIPFRRPEVPSVMAFAALVRRAGLPVTVRIERGTEIQAACGQLRLAEGQGRPSRWTPAPVPASHGGAR
ncbi:MAG TPA: 23S rRNA (adenine(2503)-C(2))-methyltransferase RlmN [bacterium]|nr:23S rRNA (adenine(2503)-C(2))-methyltransferase RlmN [bacterium]